MGREARANKSAEKSASFHHQKPVKKEVKVWSTEELRAKVLDFDKKKPETVSL